jgi:hypothetical protein
MEVWLSRLSETLTHISRGRKRLQVRTGRLSCSPCTMLHLDPLQEVARALTIMGTRMCQALAHSSCAVVQ